MPRSKELNVKIWVPCLAREVGISNFLSNKYRNDS